LLADGQVVTYRSGLELDRFDLPGFDLEKDVPKAIVSGSATGYLYVAVEDENGNGRIIASDREGNNLTVLELPVGFNTGDADVLEPFEDLQDIVVDEESGTLYLINGDAVWSFTYILPALPIATPEATP
jgi:DNA-binding beta-propeller fold protein YncE